MKQTVHTVKIGNHLSDEVVDITLPSQRSPEALAAIIAWHKEHPSAWWCINPFGLKPEESKYKGGFQHSYFDTHGRFCTIWVTYKGRIKDPYYGEATDSFRENVSQVNRLYGFFSG